MEVGDFKGQSQQPLGLGSSGRVRSAMSLGLIVPETPADSLSQN